MKRNEVANLFRERLAECITESGVSRSTLARAVGIDRSTLSQLLRGEGDRLPRADTVAAIATHLNVSLDWLLGLSNDNRLSATIVHQSLEITPSAAAPTDQQLAVWFEEARGYKIRHVPTTLPDLAKTDGVIAHEYRDFINKSTEDARSASEEKLAYTRMPETDVEICMPIQDLQVFARGEGLWRGLPVRERRAQIERLIQLTEELYPTLRLFLFDGRTNYSVPVTIFGPLRAAIYIGQMFFAFNTTEHIRVITRHFDTLIRGAVVQAPDVPAHLRDLLRDVADRAA